MFKNEIYKILKSNLFFVLFLVAIAFLLYGKCLNYDYTNHDDISLTKDRVFFLSDIKNIPKLFITSCFYSNSFQYYRPILTLSFAIETVMFGENIFIYHLTNLVLFILSLWLMYVFLCQLNLNKIILKFLIILLSVHPILTSCAVWIPARNDTLLIVFLLSSFIFFIKYLDNKKNIFAVLFFAFFILALFTKEITLVSIIIYLYLVFFFHIKLTKKQIVVFTISFILIILFFFHIKSISTIGIDYKYYLVNLKQYLFNIIVWTSIYIKQIFVPFYTPVMLYKPNFSSNMFALFIICFIIPIYLSSKNILNRRIVLLGILWFIVFLIPTYFLYDPLLLLHRTFLPIVGVVIISCELINKFVNFFVEFKRFFIPFCVCLIVLFFCLSTIQANKYESMYIYWNNAYNDAPNYHVACLFKSYIEFEADNLKKSKELIKKAMDYNYNLYLPNLAVIFFEQKKYKEAESLFLKSVKNNVDVAMSYMYLSKISLLYNDVAKAKEYALKSYKINPYNKEIRDLIEQINKET